MSDVPAGWHPDPRGRHEHRYWDGTQWTDHVADQGRMSIDPVAEVLDMVLRSEIVDAMTVIAVLRAARGRADQQLEHSTGQR